MKSINVDVVIQYEKFDWSAYATGMMLIGEIDASSTEDLVKKVVRKAIEQSAQIHELAIYAHGASNQINFGKDYIHAWSAVQGAKKLSGLKGVMDANGRVILWVCEVGQSENLLVAIARAVGAQVYANTGDISPNLRLGWGVWVAAGPDGLVDRGVYPFEKSDVIAY